MRFLFKLCLLLTLFALIGYWSFLNKRTVALGIIGDHTLHLPLWFVVVSCFLSGFFLCWFVNIWKMPSRYFQKWKQHQLAKNSMKEADMLQSLRQAYLSYNLNSVKSLKFKMQKLPLMYRTMLLDIRLIFEPAHTVFAEYRALRQQFPNHLEVLLPYQQHALQLKDWSLAEMLGREILEIEPKHPQALQNLAQVAKACGNWNAAELWYKQLLAHYPNGALAEVVRPFYEECLEKLLEQSILPSNTQGMLAQTPSFAKIQARQELENQDFLKAAKILQAAYYQTLAPSLLSELEEVFFQSGENSKIQKILETIFRKLPSISTRISSARLLFRQEQFHAAQAILYEIKDQYTDLAKEYYELCYQISLRLDDSQGALDAANHLFNEPPALVSPCSLMMYASS